MAGPVNFKHSCILCKTLEVFWHVTLIKNYYYYYWWRTSDVCTGFMAVLQCKIVYTQLHIQHLWTMHHAQLVQKIRTNQR